MHNNIATDNSASRATTGLAIAKAVVKLANEIIANNEAKAYDIEIRLGGGEYSDSASRDPKPFKGGYAQNHGGIISAKTEAEFYIREAWQKLSDLKWNTTKQGSPEWTALQEAEEYLEAEAPKFGFEL